MAILIGPGVQLGTGAAVPGSSIGFGTGAVANIVIPPSGPAFNGFNAPANMPLSYLHDVYFSAVAVNSSSVFVSVGHSNNFSPIYSTSTNGSSWNNPGLMNGSSSYARMNAITVSSSGLFVATGFDSVNAPLYATSSNGSTWTTPARMNGSSTTATITSIAVNGSGLFVAVGFNFTNLPLYATSSDGSTWTTPAKMNGSNTTATITSVAVNSSGLFVAVGYDSSTAPLYATSSNGSTWTTPARMNGSSVGAQMTAITVNSSGKFVAVGFDSSSRPVYATSTNGSTWTTPARMNTTTQQHRMYSVAVNSSGKFVAIGLKSLVSGSTLEYATSSDGSTWTTPVAINSTSTAVLLSLNLNQTKYNLMGITVNSSGRFTAVFLPDYNTLSPITATSTDGSTWSGPTDLYSFPLLEFASNGGGMAINSSGKIVAVGQATVPLGSLPGAFKTPGNGFGFVSSTNTTATVWSAPVSMNTATISSLYSYANAVAVSPTTGKWVAIGIDTSTNQNFFSSSDDGVVWTDPATMDANNTASSNPCLAVNSSGLFVSVFFDFNGVYGMAYATSSDGVTWTPTATTSDLGSNSILAIAVNPSGRFVVLANNASYVPVYYTSTNGTTWSGPNTFNGYSTANAYLEVLAVSSSGLWVAVGTDSYHGNPIYSSSTDGVNWTTPAIMDKGTLTYVQPLSIAVDSAGRFVAVGLDLSNYAACWSTSTDGTTWSAWSRMGGSTLNLSVSGGIYNLMIVAKGVNSFVVVGSDSNNYPVYADSN